jgi:hypothetical protein
MIADLDEREEIVVGRQETKRDLPADRHLEQEKSGKIGPDDGAKGSLLFGVVQLARRAEKVA